jgi:ubiquinone biosynthesis protein COQ9
MTDFDRQAARDAAIRAVLPVVAEKGWTLQAVREAAGPEADLLFPGGAADLVSAYIEMADRDMVADALPHLAAQRLSQRVRTLIAMRLDRATPHKAAVRRAVAVLAWPGNSALAARCTAGTVDSIWYAAGDSSADFSWYTKRAILASVYTATLLYWLNEANDQAASLAFLDRLLSGVARLGKLRARFAPPKAA